MCVLEHHQTDRNSIEGKQLYHVVIPTFHINQQEIELVHRRLLANRLRRLDPHSQLADVIAKARNLGYELLDVRPVEARDLAKPWRQGMIWIIDDKEGSASGGVPHSALNNRNAWVRVKSTPQLRCEARLWFNEHTAASE